MLLPGFSDPVLASQSIFRSVMEAMARPGRISDIGVELTPPAPLGIAAAALALTLLDFETPVWLDPALAAAEVDRWLAFHTGAPRADPATAAFAFIAEPATMPAFDAFGLGSVEYPDGSTTLVLEVDTLTKGETFALSGPGIKSSHKLAAAPLPADFPERMAANRARFPRGLDLVLTCGRRLAALPRSVHLSRSHRHDVELA
ncbi:MAG: phosphonate C-P lyase system protein PhnH [Xanthobacteraceae bacterium]|nr:phosphonate C-P lyase system protein PhnH [Xanthobacteraceae bacterium]